MQTFDYGLLPPSPTSPPPRPQLRENLSHSDATLFPGSLYRPLGTRLIYSDDDDDDGLCNFITKTEKKHITAVLLSRRCVVS